MAAPKGKLVRNKPFGKDGPLESRPMKARKMIAPRCPEHFGNRTNPYGGWWEVCKQAGHDPYTRETLIEHKKPVLEERDGTTYKVGEEISIEYRREPNFEQVPDELGIYSGRGVQASLERGYVFPEDLGYAPFCDYLGCSEQNPKFRTRFGNYHHRDEAGIMALRLDLDEHNDGQAMYNIETDPKAAGRQIREKLAEEGI